MRVGVSILRWFAYGGLQRDCGRVLGELLRRGHAVRLYTMRAEAPVPQGVELVELPARSWTNHQSVMRFGAAVADHLQAQPVDVHLGFDKIAGLDVYFAGDSCFLHKLHTQRPGWYRWLPRYRTLVAIERSLLAPGSSTDVLVIAPAQARQFRELYATPCARMTLLPPGIERDAMGAPEAAAARVRVRRSLLPAGREQAPLLLAVGSGFRKKGVDRAIESLLALPDAHLAIAGLDRPQRFARLAERLGVAARVSWLGPRDDVPELLRAADVLVHPARDEAGGIVLVEALAAGLPVVATDICGFAEHVRKAGAGVVLPSPFAAADLHAALKLALTAQARARFADGGRRYAAHTDLYSLPQRVADAVEARAGV